MYLTVSSSFLLSFLMGGSGQSRVIKFLNSPERPKQGIKFLYSPAPPPPTVWTLDLPTIHPVKVTRGLVCINNLCTYDLYALCIMFWMRAYPLLGGVGGDWALEFLDFFGPQMALAYRLEAISQGPKNSNSRAQPPPTSPRNEYARIQNIMHGAV
jgi:hypothetical protein